MMRSMCLLGDEKSPCSLSLPRTITFLWDLDLPPVPCHHTQATYGTCRSFQGCLKGLEKPDTKKFLVCFGVYNPPVLCGIMEKPQRWIRSQETCALTSPVQIVGVHEGECLVAVCALLSIALVHGVHHHSHLLPRAAHSLLSLLG